MITVYVKLLRFILVSAIFSVIYGSYRCFKLREGTFIVARDVASVKSYDHAYLLESNLKLGNNTLNNFRHPKQSSLNVYFTVKTTPENYEKRIRPLQMSWFQQVNKEMVSTNDVLPHMRTLARTHMGYPIRVCMHGRPI